MKSQPNRDYESNDKIMTPPDLASAIIRHFRPSGSILEPCRGDGAFYDLMPGADWCEIDQGRDFLAYSKKVDWVVTNPPWSMIRTFLQKAMYVSDHIVFMLTINHMWTKARRRDITQNGFYIAEIAEIDPYPCVFPSSGFQLGVVHILRGASPGYAWMSKISWVDKEAISRQQAKEAAKAAKEAAKKGAP